MPKAKTAAAKRPRRRIYLNKNTREWMAVVAAIVVILYAGYLLGSAAQAGAVGLAGQLRVAVRNGYGLLYLAVMLLFGGVAIGPARRHSVWLCLPAAVYLGMTVYRLVQPLTVAAALVYTVVIGTPVPTAGQLVLPLVLVLAPYLLQTAVLVSLALLLFGRGQRVVHLVLCVLWPLAAAANNIVYMTGGLRQNGPTWMLIFAFFAAAVLLALPAIAGKRVAASHLAALAAAERGPAEQLAQALTDAERAAAPDAATPADGEAATSAESAPAEGEAAASAEDAPTEGEAATSTENAPAEEPAAADVAPQPDEKEGQV